MSSSGYGNDHAIITFQFQHKVQREQCVSSHTCSFSFLYIQDVVLVLEDEDWYIYFLQIDGRVHVCFNVNKLALCTTEIVIEATVTDLNSDTTVQCKQRNVPVITISPYTYSSNKLEIEEERSFTPCHYTTVKVHRHVLNTNFTIDPFPDPRLSVLLVVTTYGHEHALCLFPYLCECVDFWWSFYTQRHFRRMTYHCATTWKAQHFFNRGLDIACARGDMFPY